MGELVGRVEVVLRAVIHHISHVTANSMRGGRTHNAETKSDLYRAARPG